MPPFTPDVLRDAITGGTIRAISLDTNIFYKPHPNLESPMLRRLDQFKCTDISVIFLEIVVREIKKKIKYQAKQTRSKLKASFQKCQERWRSNFDFDTMLQLTGIDVNFDDLVNGQFSEFREHVAAIIIPVKGNVNIEKLVDNYFDTEPPFENKKEKKHEFPDAMALLSLEAWAKQCGNYVLLVSKDSGWQKFSELSDYLFCVEDLAVALDYFNEDGRLIAVQAVSMLQNETANTLSGKIEVVIRNYLARNDFSVNADLCLAWEGEIYEADLQNWQVSEFTQPHIIAFDEETVTFTVDLECTVKFTANFGFYLYDSVDKDCVHVGNEEFSKKDDIQLSVLLTISRNFHPEPKCIKAYITTQRIEVNFGSIEPDWGYEEW
ncbi:MAG: PIN domain-containing protein [Hyphomicrobiales bacterium]|nr:PIN domain-containing protein [Hyphomicrobiales bacterium]